jgi:hypothetical protein
MNATDLRDQWRADVADIEQPTLWGDDEFIRWLDDAQTMFCRLTWSLGDASSPLTKLTFAVGDTWVDTSPLITKIRDAYRVTDGTTIEILNYENLRQEGFRLDDKRGPVRSLIIGIEAHKARLWPIPSVADTIQLVVDRLPLKAVIEDGKLEIDAQHLLSLLYWVSHKAYSKQDAETYDRDRAAQFKQMFEAYCAQAKREKDRAMHKTRIVAYGGIGDSIGMGSTYGRNRGRRNSCY